MAKERTKARMSTSPVVNCMKVLLFGFNFIFWMMGLAILAIGIWMKVDLYRYMQLTTVYYEEAPYVLIGIGALIVIIGGLGCCCACKGHGRLLYMYALFLMIIFIADLAAGIAGFVYRQKLEKGYEDGLQIALRLYGTESDKDHIKTKTIDEVQRTLKCCGVQNYTDWFSTPWEKAQKGKNSVPTSCCQKPKCKTMGLPAKYHKSSIIYSEGCHKQVVTFLEKNLAAIAGVVIGISFLNLIGALFACFVARGLNKANYENIA